MMTLLATLAGYLLGSLPTANWLAHRRGLDLRRDGSGNPGTNNALRVGGPKLAAAVLAIELVKGYAALRLGLELAGQAGAVSGGLAAVIGNVVNVWYRGSGGKGLAISGGVLAAASPLLLVVSVGVIGLVALATRSSGKAALVAFVALTGGAVALWSTARSAPGVVTGAALIALTLGMTIVMAPKHWRDARIRRSGLPASR